MEEVGEGLAEEVVVDDHETCGEAGKSRDHPHPTSSRYIVRFVES